MVLDQGSLTQLMILIRLFDRTDRTGEIAKSIGITVQGVNYHLKLMRKKGLITEDNKLSKEGVNFLESGLSSLRDFVSENLTKIDNLVTWEAIADEDISGGDMVHTYLNSGYLHASLSGQDPTGISKNKASAGEIIAVTSISSIIGVSLGSISIYVLPPIEEISDPEAFALQLKSLIQEGDLIAVAGEQAYGTLHNQGIEPDMEFAPLHGVFEAASRGISSSLFISSRRFHYMLSDLKELQNKFKDIIVKIKYL